ncbi:MAG: hypothetical protein K2I49_01175 [Ureaplasma sp.]|nr:hypothetical protein [Ureaplasma sp.]
MSNKSLILNLYNQSIDYLDLTFLDESLIELLKTKEDFRKTVSNLLTFIVDCEDNELVTNKNQERLLAAYTALTNKEFEPNSTITFKTESELESEVNSFNEYLIQNLDKNFDKVKIEFQEKHVDEAKKVESEVFAMPVNNETGSMSNDNSANQSSTDNKTEKEFNTEEFINNSKANFQDMAESMIMASANSMLIMNIRKGSVYQYKSKPKIIPILKWLIVAVICVVIALSIASYTVLMVAGPVTVYDVGKTDSEGNPLTYSTFLTTSFPFQLIFTILILVMMILSMVRNSKNENFKYYMSWGWMLMYVLVLIFVWFMVGGLTNSIIFDFNYFKDAVLVNGKESPAIPFINAYRAIQFTIIGLLGLVVVFLIVSCVFNPKRDFERMQLLVQEYVNEIKSGSMPFDGGMNGFGRYPGSLF